MAYCNLSYSGHKGVINAAAYVTELNTAGTTRRVRLRLTVWAVDYTGARDASYSVRCTQSGTDVSVGMYQGFAIDGSEQTVFDETFSVYVASGTSTASVELSFQASLLSPSSGTRTISGTVTTLYLTEESAESPQEPEPSRISISPASVQLGESVVISLTRDSSACWHRLSYWVGGENMGIFASNVATAYLWKVPDISAHVSDSLTLAVTVKCSTYTGTANYVGQTEASFQVTLPEATQPECAASVQMGQTLTVSLPRQCDAYRHTLSYTLAGSTGSIASDAGESCVWSVPLALAKLVPAQKEATCTITCVTKVKGLTVGKKTFVLRLTVPDNEQTKPSATMVLSPDAQVPEAFSGMYISTITGVKAVFTASSDYSQIKSYQLTVDGMTASGNPAVTAPVHAYGNVTVTGRVTDARGFVRVITSTVSVKAYEKPRIVPYPGESAVVAIRCNSDGSRNPMGRSLLIRAGRKYTALVNNRGEQNTCRLQYRYKLAGAESYGDFYDLLENQADGDSIQMTVANLLPDVKNGYSVQIRAMDDLGSYSVLTVPVGASSVPLHIGKGNANVAIGKYCDYSRENAFEIGLTTHFDTGIALRKIFTQGSWAVGTELGSTVAEAEVSAVNAYTLFMGVCSGLPVWLMKLDDGIYGSGIKMTWNGSSLILDTAASPVTALYAVL